MAAAIPPAERGAGSGAQWEDAFYDAILEQCAPAVADGAGAGARGRSKSDGRLTSWPAASVNLGAPRPPPAFYPTPDHPRAAELGQPVAGRRPSSGARCRGRAGVVGATRRATVESIAASKAADAGPRSSAYTEWHDATGCSEASGDAERPGGSAQREASPEKPAGLAQKFQEVGQARPAGHHPAH